MIRKSAILIILITIVLFGGSTWLFSDHLIQKLIETVLEQNLKTDVRLDGISTSILDMEAGFDSLQIKASKQSEVNVFTTGPARFDMLGMPLLANKLIIDEISLKNITLIESSKVTSSTDESGQASTETNSQEEKESDSSSLKDLAKNLPDIDLDSLSKELDVDEYVHPEKLKSVIAINKAKKEGEEKIGKWKEKIITSTVDKDIKEIEVSAEKLSKKKVSTLKDLQSAQKDWISLQKRIHQTKQEITTSYKQASKDLKSVTISYDEIEKLAAEDYEEAKKLAKIKDIDASSVGKMLFGKEIVERFETVLKYLKIADEFFEEDETQAIERKSVKMVDFPVTGTVYPSFLVKQMTLDGQLVDEQLNPQYSWSGTLNNLTHEQHITKIPTLLRITADNTASSAKYQIQGSFDYIGKDHKSSIQIFGDQLKLVDIDLKRDGNVWPTNMSSDDADLNVKLVLKKESFAGTIVLLANSVKFTFSKRQASKKDFKSETIRDMFDDFKSVEIKSSLTGSLSNPDFSLSTNIDNILARRLKQLVGKKLQEAQDKIKKKVDSEVNKVKNLANKALNQEKAKILNKLDFYKKEIKKKEKEANVQIVAQKKKIDKELKKRKKELEDKAKKELEKKKKEQEKNLSNQLKNLLNQ